MKRATGVRPRILSVAGIAMLCALLTSCASMTPLHEAAMRGDVPRIDEYVKKGIPVNKQDVQGNTPLHYAYYYGQKEAIERLTAYGADLTIRNKDGDTPVDMQKIASAETLIHSAAQLLDAEGDWTDNSRGRPLYDNLREMDGSIVIKAIVRKVIRDENRLRVLFLAVKLGISGSEERLNDVLHAYGDKSMAEDFLNSGSTSLYEGGKGWANSHGYYISTGMGSHRVGWGRF
jgi:ankyrin repeat protein